MFELYTIIKPIHQITSGQSSHFYNMNHFITGSLYPLITLLYQKSFPTLGAGGSYVSFYISCCVLICEMMVYYIVVLGLAGVVIFIYKKMRLCCLLICKMIDYLKPSAINVQLIAW